MMKVALTVVMNLMLDGNSILIMAGLMTISYMKSNE